MLHFNIWILKKKIQYLCYFDALFCKENMQILLSIFESLDWAIVTHVILAAKFQFIPNFIPKNLS